MARRTALLIGNDDYRDADLQRLIAPWDDVVSFKDVLEDVGDFECVPPLYNANLSKAQTAIAKLFRDAAHDDMILLYYTGHGVRDEDGDLFLALPDTDVDLLQANAISAGFIRDAMRRSNARAQVVILDCCHSGAFKMEGGKRRGGPESLRKGDLLDVDAGDVAAEGKYILTASEPNQSAYELAGKSVFTRHLVEGLTDGAAAPEKEKVTVQDLHAYVYRMVKDDGAPQRPRLMMAASSPELAIARNPDPRRPLRQDILDVFWGSEPYGALGAAYQLIAVADGPDERLAADARSVLAQRLEQPETVPLLVARPIQDWLEPPVAESQPGFSEEQVQALRAEAAETEARLTAEINDEQTRTAARDEEIATLKAVLADAGDELTSFKLRGSESQEQLKAEIGDKQKQIVAQAAENAKLKVALKDANGALQSVKSDAAEARSLVQRQTEDAKQARQTLESEIAKLRKTQWTGKDDPKRILRDGRRAGWQQMGLAAIVAIGALSFLGYAQHMRVLQTLNDKIQAETGLAAPDLEASRQRIAQLEQELERTKQENAGRAGDADTDTERRLTELQARKSELEQQHQTALEQIQEMASDEGSRTEPPSEPTARQDLEVFSDCAGCPEMIVLPAGTFVMGSPEDEEGRSDYEGPQRDVNIRRFAMAATEVTFDQWQACVDDGGCQSNPSPDDGGWGRGTRPVINVSWNHAQEYVDWLNGKGQAFPEEEQRKLDELQLRMDAEAVTGRGPTWRALKAERDELLASLRRGSTSLYRLPSEAEWEYAARAGTTTPFAFGDTISTDQANYDGNSAYGSGPNGTYRQRTVPVEDLDAANDWGLRHMHGNVWEWVEDCWHGDYSGAPVDGSAWLSSQSGSCKRRVLRGGSWFNSPQNLRSAYRYWNVPEFRVSYIGFRPARTLITP